MISQPSTVATLSVTQLYTSQSVDTAPVSPPVTQSADTPILSSLPVTQSATHPLYHHCQ